MSTSAAWSEEDISAVSDSVSAGRLSPQLMPVGLKSEEGSSALGMEGQIFLIGGSNSLSDQYEATFNYGNGGFLELARQWGDLFESRQVGCVARGISYIQVIIPEKLTTLRHLAPIRVSGPTPLFAEIENLLGQASYYVSGFQALEDWSKPNPPFATGDSHLSPLGAQSVFRAILDNAFPEILPQVDSIVMDETVYRKGDLTARFYNLPIYSEIRQPSASQMTPFSKGLKTVKRYFPDEGHIGRRFHHSNDSAPSPLRVLVFGNSFFSAGDIPGELSWWGKHFFQEINLIWQPQFDWAIVDEMKPDLVIGQTIERFLTSIPSS